MAGFFGPADGPLLAAMMDVQAHRGPDDEGQRATPAASLGFRRLSILDLAHGQQPMTTDDGLVSIVYNGEVYTHRELRAELVGLGHAFHTDCDTEVVLHAYAEWGTASFTRLNGMFALAVLDERGPAPVLVLARDHFGIKPLYYATAPSGRILFASELKALLADPTLSAAPDEDRLLDYLTRGLHDHTDGTFFAHLKQVPAAHFAVVDHAGVRTERYWQPELSSDGDPSRFRELFWRSVERRLLSDVPVGTCLSGGLDSSTIVVAMTDLLRRQVPDATSMGDRLTTFSAVFDGDPIDESGYIRTVLAATGAANVEIRPTSKRFFDELADFVWHLEEPTVSTGPYAQWCVQQVARDRVTVLLDGQGGDELLAGYVPYQLVYLRQLRRERRWTELAREAAKSADLLAPLVRQRLTQARRRLPVASLLRPQWVAARTPAVDHRVADQLKLRLLQDLTTYSLPSLLRYEDRNSMAASLEARPPFLDQELVEWVLTLPDTALVHDGWSRAVLRDGMQGWLPESIRLRRKKIGFTTPETRWLKARRARVRGLFRSPSFQARPYWDGPAVARAWDQACEGRYEDSFVFWRVLVVEVWLRMFVDGADQAPVRQGFRAGGTASGLREAAADAAVLAGLPGGVQTVAGLTAHPDRHLLCCAGGTLWARGVFRSPPVAAGADLAALLGKTLGDAGLTLTDGDVVAVGEQVLGVTPHSADAAGPATGFDAKAAELARALSERSGAAVSVAVVGGDDIDVTVVGAAAGAGAAEGRDLVGEIVRDDPLGLDRAPASFAVLRRVPGTGPEPAQAAG